MLFWNSGSTALDKYFLPAGWRPKETPRLAPRTPPCFEGRVRVEWFQGTAGEVGFRRRGFVRRAARPAPIPEVEAPLVSASSPSGPKQLIEGKHKAPRCSISVATHTAKNWGGRHENEDRCMASQDSLTESFPFHTVGVLDGHDTDSASDLVAKLLPGAVGRRIKEGLPIGQAYMEAMAEMEDKLKKEHATAGTCVNSCTIAGGRVWCANLGDCRAALVTLEAPSPGAVKAEALTWLSRDHKASCPIEQKRIEAVGGSVIDGRVEGLEPSRSMKGDGGTRSWLLEMGDMAPQVMAAGD
eukprot:Skav235051  [mRNA]  locus=scaffold3697:22561:46412:- [translate_table: standard]